MSLQYNTQKTILAIAVTLALSACSSSGTGSRTTFDNSNYNVQSSKTDDKASESAIYLDDANGNGSTVVRRIPATNANSNGSTSTTNTSASTTNTNNVVGNNNQNTTPVNTNTSSSTTTASTSVSSTNTSTINTSTSNNTNTSISPTNTVSIGVSSHNMTDTQVVQSNTNLKANNVSSVNLQAQQALEKAKTAVGSAVAIVDWGVDKSTYAGLSSANIDDVMDTSQGVKPNSEATASSHGSRMTKVVVDNAPKTRIREYGNIYGDNVGQMLRGGMKTYEALANNPEVTSNTIVISNSYTNGQSRVGGEYGYTSIGMELADFYTKNTNGHTGLFVMSTGNEGVNNAADTTRMASAAPKLKPIFIAVTGLDEANNQVFNDCGAAAEYCIAAPASHTLMTNSNSEMITTGTSPAAAYIASEAAKIASNYDWANSSQVKDMIFTNAIPQRRTSEYGVGIYSSNALKGYGKFVNQVELNVEGKEDIYFMSNNIGGTGSLVKKGSDTLALTGNNNYTGPTTIVEGALVLNGRNLSAMTTEQGGKLVVGDNTKSIINSGSVNNKGTLVSQSLADFNINGDLNTTGSIDKYIGSTIKVTGNANLDGTLNVTGVANGYVTKSGSTETLISANKVNGSFKNINITDTSLVNTTVSTDDKGVYAKVGRNTIGGAVYSEGFKSTEIAKAADTSEKVLSVIDNKIDNGIELNNAEKAYAADMFNTNLVAKTAFDNSIDTHARAQQTLSRNNGNRIHNLIENTLAKQEIWANSNYNSPKYKVNDIQTDSKNSGANLGVTLDIDNQQTIGVLASTNKAEYTESFAGSQKTMETKTNGVDVAYTIKGKVNYPDVYVTAGADKIKVENGGSGKEFRLGTGVNKSLQFGNMILSPNAGLFYSESNLKNIDVNSLTEIEKLTYKQLFARAGVKSDYFINPNWSVFGSLAVQRDLFNKTNSTSKIAGVEVADTLKGRKETQGNVSIGTSFSKNNFTVNASVEYQKSRNWANKGASVGVSYKF